MKESGKQQGGRLTNPGPILSLPLFSLHACFLSRLQPLWDRKGREINVRLSSCDQSALTEFSIVGPPSLCSFGLLPVLGLWFG